MIQGGHGEAANPRVQIIPLGGSLFISLRHRRRETITPSLIAAVANKCSSLHLRRFWMRQGSDKDHFSSALLPFRNMRWIFNIELESLRPLTVSPQTERRWWRHWKRRCRSGCGIRRAFLATPKSTPMTERRFPLPRSIDEQTESFIVKDATGLPIAYIYFEDEPQRQMAMKRMSRDEAFLIAVNIAKLPRVPRQILKDIPRPLNSAGRDDWAPGNWHFISLSHATSGAFAPSVAIFSLRPETCRRVLWCSHLPLDERIPQPANGNREFQRWWFY